MPTTFPRIMFLDMEGTLLQKEHRLDDGRVAPSAWTVLAERLGPECLAEENATKDVWNAQGYPGYLEWMRASVEIHKRFVLRRSVFESVMDSITLTRNAEQAISALHERGSITVLITGGFKALADKVQRRLKIHHAFAGCEYFFSESTELVEHVNLLPADEVGKVDFMRLMCREYAFDPKDCAFVGDGKNDVKLACEVGFSIAFNAQQALRDVATTVVNQAVGEEDFLAVARAVVNHYDSRTA